MKCFGLVILFACCALGAQESGKGPVGGNPGGGPIDNGGGLIGGIDYMGHNVGLINKHGWEFKTQRLFNGYLKNYYTETAGVIKHEMSESAAWVPGGTTDVRGYGHDSAGVVSPADHIIDSYGHLRPAIVRYWSGP